MDPATNLAPEPKPEPEPSRGQIWTSRILLVIAVIFFVELGMVLLVVPWTPLWQRNNLLIGHLTLKHFVEHPFVRGAVSGLGLVNLWMGISEAVHYREVK